MTSKKFIGIGHDSKERSVRILQNCIGYNVDDTPIHTHVGVKSLEDYLLQSTSFTSDAKRRARFLEQKIFLGKFRPAGETTGFMNYYLIWCNNCKKYEVSYLRGYAQVTVCRSCERKRIRINLPKS